MYTDDDSSVAVKTSVDQIILTGEIKELATMSPPSHTELFAECIFHGTNTPGEQSLPQIHFQGKDIPVQMPALRPSMSSPRS